MNSEPVVTVMIQAGGLGIAAYLVWWLTRGLNGKLERLTGAISRLTEQIEALRRET
jgi:hypothetical protein